MCENDHSNRISALVMRCSPSRQLPNRWTSLNFVLPKCGRPLREVLQSQNRRRTLLIWLRQSFVVSLNGEIVPQLGDVLTSRVAIMNPDHCCLSSSNRCPLIDGTKVSARRFRIGPSATAGCYIWSSRESFRLTRISQRYCQR